LHFRYTKLLTCPSCGVPIFLDDEGARLAGEQSVLSEEPSLVVLNQPFTYHDENYTPIGHIRFGVGRNIWDEWWVLDSGGKGYWLSIDDGDYILEKKVNFTLPIHSFKALKMNQEIQGWHVTELGRGKCLGFEGELPEIISVGETHHYAHLSKENGQMLTIEFFKNSKMIFSGKWLDPYEIRGALSS
jgi:hypothetical protein